MILRNEYAYLHQKIEIRSLSYLRYYAEACKEWRSSEGRVARASASGAVDSGLIPSRVKPMTLNLVVTASLLDAQQNRTVYFSTPQAIDFKIYCLVINLRQEIQCSTDWGSEKPVLATCSQPPQAI